ncbi:hypothetical protein [Flavicella sp.]|uniref:energy transducer TonB n=1 Tax=Flavicella sp. TaxID=2957742 RepID=UPI003015C051
MKPKKNTYSDLKKYLQNKLSDKERYTFEKNVSKDAFEEEAMQGLDQIDSHIFLKDTKNIQHQIKNKLIKKGILVRIRKYNMAASVVLIIGMASYFYLTNRPDLAKDPIFNTPVLKERKSIKTKSLEKINIDNEEDLEESVFESIDAIVHTKKEERMNPKTNRIVTAPEHIQEVKIQKKKHAIGATLNIKTSEFDSTEKTDLRNPIKEKAVDITIPNRFNAIPPQQTKQDFTLWVKESFDSKLLKKGTTVTIQIEFTISKNGGIKNIKTDSNRTINKELKRILKSSEIWQAATENGKPVKEKIVLTFELSNNL